jgi:hypothetical protein
MRRVLLGLIALGAMATIVPSAMADQTKLDGLEIKTFDNYHYNFGAGVTTYKKDVLSNVVTPTGTMTGEFLWHRDLTAGVANDYGYPEYKVLPVLGGNFKTFCIEIGQWAQPSVFTVMNLEAAPTLKNQSNLATRTGILQYLWAMYTIDKTQSGVNMTDLAGKMQLAVWETVFENSLNADGSGLSLAAPTVSPSTDTFWAGNTIYLSAADAYLAEAVNRYNQVDGYKDLSPLTVYALVNASNQDQALFLSESPGAGVPLPSAAAGVLSLLGCLGLVRTRRV